MAKDFKARMTVRLAVAGAFHTHFMKPAEEKLRSAQAFNDTPSLRTRGSLSDDALMSLSCTELTCP